MRVGAARCRSLLVAACRRMRARENHVGTGSASTIATGAARRPASSCAAPVTSFPFFDSAASDFLQTHMGLPGADVHDHRVASAKRFPDGGQFRVEIPSTEGVAAFKAVIEESKKYDVSVHRVSQGSGINMMPKGEQLDMLRIGRDNGIEVCLFVGPRNAWDVGAVAKTEAGMNSVSGHRGMDQLVFALEDVMRGCELGLRSVLCNDPGLIYVIDAMKKAGKLPANLVQKTSVQLGSANAVACKLLADSGANTINPPTDLTVPQLAAIRQAVDVPLDLYVEAPDNFGGFVRHYEVPAMIRAVSPVYVKLGLKKHGDVYPSGGHLEGGIVALSRERVRRARLVLDIIDRYYPEAEMSPVGAADLGIPEL